MVQFDNVDSFHKLEQSWSDDLHVYVLLKQEPYEKTLRNNKKITAYTCSYAQYTHDEFNQLITQDLKEQLCNKLDQSLDTVKANKIAESKKLLEQYYKENPLFSTVHKSEGEYYSITSDKQSYLSLMISLCEQAEELGQQFTPTWNATGESCEPWTKTELKQLALQIAQRVYPAVSKQQSYEKQIEQMENVEEIQNLEITYEDTQDETGI